MPFFTETYRSPGVVCIIRICRCSGGYLIVAGKTYTELDYRRDTLRPAKRKSLQSCLTLCDPIDGSPPGSPVPGILQARTLEWVAISFFNA